MKLFLKKYVPGLGKQLEIEVLRVLKKLVMLGTFLIFLINNRPLSFVPKALLLFASLMQRKKYFLTQKFHSQKELSFQLWHWFLLQYKRNNKNPEGLFS